MSDQFDRRAARDAVFSHVLGTHQDQSSRPVVGIVEEINPHLGLAVVAVQGGDSTLNIREGVYEFDLTRSSDRPQIIETRTVHGTGSGGMGQVTKRTMQSNYTRFVVKIPAALASGLHSGVYSGLQKGLVHCILNFVQGSFSPVLQNYVLVIDPDLSETSPDPNSPNPFQNRQVRFRVTDDSANLLFGSGSTRFAAIETPGHNPEDNEMAASVQMGMPGYLWTPFNRNPVGATVITATAPFIPLQSEPGSLREIDTALLAGIHVGTDRKPGEHWKGRLDFWSDDIFFWTHGNTIHMEPGDYPRPYEHGLPTSFVDNAAVREAEVELRRALGRDRAGSVPNVVLDGAGWWWIDPAIAAACIREYEHLFARAATRNDPGPALVDLRPRKPGDHPINVWGRALLVLDNSPESYRDPGIQAWVEYMVPVGRMPRNGRDFYSNVALFAPVLAYAKGLESLQPLINEANPLSELEPTRVGPAGVNNLLVDPTIDEPAISCSLAFAGGEAGKPKGWANAFGALVAALRVSVINAGPLFASPDLSGSNLLSDEAFLMFSAGDQKFAVPNLFGFPANDGRDDEGFLTSRLLQLTANPQYNGHGLPGRMPLWPRMTYQEAIGLNLYYMAEQHRPDPSRFRGISVDTTKSLLRQSTGVNHDLLVMNHIGLSAFNAAGSGLEKMQEYLFLNAMWEYIADQSTPFPVLSHEARLDLVAGFYAAQIRTVAQEILYLTRQFTTDFQAATRSNQSYATSLTPPALVRIDNRTYRIRQWTEVFLAYLLLRLFTGTPGRDAARRYLERQFPHVQDAATRNIRPPTITAQSTHGAVLGLVREEIVANPYVDRFRGTPQDEFNRAWWTSVPDRLQVVGGWLAQSGHLAPEVSFTNSPEGDPMAVPATAAPGPAPVRPPASPVAVPPPPVLPPPFR